MSNKSRKKTSDKTTILQKIVYKTKKIVDKKRRGIYIVLYVVAIK